MKARLEPRMVAARVPFGCAAGFVPAARAATAWATPRSHGPAVAVLIVASVVLGGEAPDRAVRRVDRLLDDLLLPRVGVGVEGVAHLLLDRPAGGLVGL